MGSVSEWKLLRQEIRQAPDRAKALDDKITSALYRYRIHLTKLSIKPHRLDRQIWESYDSILAEIKRLRPRSKARLLGSIANLASLYDEWLTVFNRQEEFLSLIDETIERSNFYNKMENAKDDLSREREQEAKVQFHLSAARRNLIQALHYVLLREKSGEGITSGSIILDLGLSIDSWEQAIAEILSLQSEKDVSPEDEIGRLESLRLRIIEAPRWAEEIKALEEEFDSLLSLEDQLRNISGTGNLSDIEVNELVELLRVDTKAHWAESNWTALEDVIKLVQSYIQREIGPLQSQLYVLRKRKGYTPFANGSREPETAEEDNLAVEASDIEPPEEQADGERRNGLFDGSLIKAIAENNSDSNSKRVYVDPDADESVRSVFARRRGQKGD